MNQRVNQIGFSQRVRLEWVEQTANQVLAGNDRAAIKEALQELLKEKVSVGGHADRGNREKIITILMKIWFKPPLMLESLRTRGLELLRTTPRSDHKFIHWGMIMAVYPFWSGIAALVGRLLRLQGTVSTSQVLRRVREQYGERETVSRAAQRVLRSYFDWGILLDPSGRGVFNAGPTQIVDDTRLIVWVLEAFLHSRENGAFPLKELLDSPCLFPFQLRLNQADSLVAASPYLDMLRHGLDEDLIMLRDRREAGIAR